MLQSLVGSGSIKKALETAASFLRACHRLGAMDLASVSSADLGLGSNALTLEGQVHEDDEALLHGNQSPGKMWTGCMVNVFSSYQHCLLREYVNDTKFRPKGALPGILPCLYTTVGPTSVD